MKKAIRGQSKLLLCCALNGVHECSWCHEKGCEVNCMSYTIWGNLHKGKCYDNMERLVQTRDHKRVLKYQLQIKGQRLLKKLGLNK